MNNEHIFRARDLNARLLITVIDADPKISYDKCWQEKLQAEFAVRNETHGAHGGNKLITYRTFKNTYSQWRSEGNWRPGANLNFAPPPSQKIPKK